MIHVNKTFLPPKEEYMKLIDCIWESNWLTNNGPLLLKLEGRLKSYFNCEFLNYTSNGTVAIQIALKSIGADKEIITTPYSYVATTNSILWEGAKPVFADLEENSFFPSTKNIENLISADTSAILVTHVYGLAGNTSEIESLGRKYGIPVIFDSAHSFGSKYQNKSLCTYGDIATLSFHATKLFHTVEGGAIVTNDSEIDNKVKLLRSFGHIKDEYFSLGINGKNSEFHAAMGLCMLGKVPELILQRKSIFECYISKLNSNCIIIDLKSHPNLEWNYSYFPVVFNTKEVTQNVTRALNENNIFPRRYFYPSLNKLPYFKSNDCPISESLAQRVLALPFYVGLSESEIEAICNIINKVVGS